MNKTFILAILIIAIVVVLKVCVFNKESKSSYSSEHFTPINMNGSEKKILFKNHLSKSVKIKVGDDDVVVVKLHPKSSKTVPLSGIVNMFRTPLGNDEVFTVYTFDQKLPNEPEEKYGEYTIDLDSDSFVKRLFIGGVTSRFVGSTFNYPESLKGNGNILGIPFVNIHNLTDRTLSLNYNIRIPPNSTLKYLGRNHFGVRLGTVFSDNDGLYSDYIFKVPATDIYYGVVSDIEQASFGGYQLYKEFIHSNREPQFLLQEGWIGGPAKGLIEFGYIPKEGPNTIPMDRWGDVIKESERWVPKIVPDPQSYKM